MKPRPIWLALISIIAALVGCFMVFTQGGYAATFAQVTRLSFVYALVILICSIIGNLWTAALIVPIGLYTAYLAVARLQTLGEPGGPGYWLFFSGFLLAAVYGAGRVRLTKATENEPAYRKALRRILPLAAAPFVLFLLWQGLSAGRGAPEGDASARAVTYAQTTTGPEPGTGIE